eukprot:168416-Chlamydomonas_euryale.AAC.2
MDTAKAVLLVVFIIVHWRVILTLAGCQKLRRYIYICQSCRSNASRVPACPCQQVCAAVVWMPNGQGVCADCNKEPAAPQPSMWRAAAARSESRVRRLCRGREGSGKGEQQSMCEQWRLLLCCAIGRLA